jgi:hypothetical protein
LGTLDHHDERKKLIVFPRSMVKAAASFRRNLVGKNRDQTVASG